PFGALVGVRQQRELVAGAAPINASSAEDLVPGVGLGHTARGRGVIARGVLRVRAIAGAVAQRTAVAQRGIVSAVAAARRRQSALCAGGRASDDVDNAVDR